MGQPDENTEPAVEVDETAPGEVDENDAEESDAEESDADALDAEAPHDGE